MNYNEELEDVGQEKYPTRGFKLIKENDIFTKWCQNGAKQPNNINNTEKTNISNV